MICHPSVLQNLNEFRVIICIIMMMIIIIIMIIIIMIIIIIIIIIWGCLNQILPLMGCYIMVYYMNGAEQVMSN